VTVTDQSEVEKIDQRISSAQQIKPTHKWRVCVRTACQLSASEDDSWWWWITCCVQTTQIIITC